MKITVNGRPREVAEGLPLEGLLAQLNLAGAQVVVERNGEPLEPARFAGVVLEPDDTLEIVRFVGGG